MSGTASFGIRKKLFLIVLVVLGLNLAVLLFMGSALFESLYLYSKRSELRTSALKIQVAYQREPEGIYEELYALEGKNSMAYIFTVGEDGVTVEYEYGPQPLARDDHDRNELFLPRQRYRAFAEKELLERVGELAGLEKGILVKDANDPQPKLYALASLGGNRYLYVESPKSYIKSIADLAVRYTAMLSMGIFAAGAVLIYIVVGRITRPLRSMQQAAERLARFDFSERCEEKGDDEIALLAKSVNHMSRQLEANIAELMKANAVLQNDLTRQQEIDRMRKEFVANVSHDFKTPLTLIIGYAEALRDRNGDGLAREYADTIIDEGNRMSVLVARLLRLSQLESGRERLERDNFCVTDVVDEVLNNLKLLAKKKSLTVRRDIPEPYIVNADYHKIGQALTNLVENAVKYAPVGGSIAVCARRKQNSCVLSVYNSGSHIPEQEAENIFISFYRADKARERATQSYGLGLAIVKTVMELHGGGYGVRNLSQGEGVEFWISLDLAELEG